MSLPRGYFGLVPVEGKVYAIGGGKGALMTPLDLNEMYDPVKDTWTTLPPLPTPRRAVGSAAVGSIIYIIGGSNDEAILDTVEAFDTRTQTWSKRAPMPTPRTDVAVAAANGLLYAIGGFDGHHDFSLVEIYDPQTDTWRPGPPMPTSRYALTAATLDGRIYAIGGRSNGELTAANEMLDPTTGIWTGRAPMSEGRASFGAGVLGDRIHVVMHTDHESYDPRTNRWQREADLPLSRHAVVATGSGSMFFAVGGCSEQLRDVARVDVLTTRQ